MPDYFDWTEEELKMTSYELFRKLRREVHWTENDIRAELKAESERLENQKIEEWQRKELVFYNWLEALAAMAVRHGADQNFIEKIQEDLPYPPLPIVGPTPWFRQNPPADGQQNATDEVGKWVEGVGDHGKEPQRIAEA